MSNIEDGMSDRLSYLGALSGGVAHEIRNPLSTINLNIQLLLEDLGDEKGEKGRRAKRKLEIIQKETRRLEQILDDFLKVARGHELNLRECDLNHVLGEILDFFSSGAAANKIQIRRGLSSDLPQIYLDAALMKQAITNLLKNGIEAMPNGGELIVRTSCPIEGFVQVDIADTGQGIAPNKIEKVFRPYFTTKKSGTGLGLATTKRIIEEHGGQITLISEEGKGTNFSIRLPIKVAEIGN